MIQAIIFDFDGLIVDTETPDCQSWQEIYQSYGCDLPLAEWTAFIGRGSGDIKFDLYDILEAQLKHSIDRNVVRTARRMRKMDIVAMQPVLPGVERYIADAKRLGLKVGLASSSGAEWVKGHLTRVGLIEHFECIRCSEDVTRTKPDPELYQAVLQAMNVQPHEAIALEDSANGALAAKRAGMYCVAVPNSMTSGLNFDHVDYRLSSMLEMDLAELIQRVSSQTVKDIQ